MSEGWTVHVRTPDGDVELERLADDADEWYREGPGGSALGTLAEVAGDAEWYDVVVTAVRRGGHPVGLGVWRGEGEWFHATRSVNRESIARHGLDWRRMSAPGIAGSHRPEYPGIFLGAMLEDAHWFTGMTRGEPADIWSVRVDGVWLIGDPGAGGGIDDNWAIATEPLPPGALRLVERDLVTSRG
jgi:hypothetical protein